jgi:hypothetical protein
MKTFLQRRGAKIALAIASACIIGAAFAAPPGPTTIGEFYYYFDASGHVTGYRAIDCNGNYTSWGKTSTQYSNGYAICNPNN